MTKEKAYEIINNTFALLLKIGQGELEEIPNPNNPEEKVKGHSCFFLADYFPNLEEAIGIVHDDMASLRTDK